MRRRWLVERLTYLGCSALVACSGENAGSSGGECKASRLQLETIDPGEGFEREMELKARLNQQRAQGGCCGELGCFEPSGELAWNESLASAASDHASDMAERNYFDHMTPEGRSPSDRAIAHDYAGCLIGENLAEGQDSADRVMQDWMASDEHCSNVLELRFEVVGIRAQQGRAGRLLWVADFGG